MPLHGYIPTKFYHSTSGTMVEFIIFQAESRCTFFGFIKPIRPIGLIVSPARFITTESQIMVVQAI